MATRRERVILELEDQFTSGMARAAASAALLNKELDSLSRDSIRTRRSLSDIDRPAQNLGKSAASSTREVDKLSGRMRILADVAAVLGPSLIPIGAVGIPAVAGLATQLGLAAGAGVTAIIAFQGVGGALKALNAAALEPTQANLEKAQVALEDLSPAARGFVAEVGHLLPELKQLRDVAAGGLFPGLTAGLVEMESALPKVANVIGAISQELGDIAVDAGASLASEKWTSFLDFVAAEAPEALADMAKAAGNTAHAIAELWMATDPLNDDFSQWLVDATADIDRWASHLSKTQGFADFLAYVETTGPKVAEAFGAIANAVIQILQAAAPLGGPVLEGVKALADVVAAIADSDLGTPLFTAAAGLALFNRTLGLTRAVGATTFGSMIANEVKASAGIRTLIGDLRILQRQAGFVTLPGKNFIGPLTQAQAATARLKATLPAVAKTSALIGGIAVASTGAADKIGLTNTASLALMGTLAGPWGAAIGGAIGLMIDAKSAGAGFADSMNRANLALKGVDTSAIERSIRELERQKKDLQDVTGVGDFFGDLGGQLSRPKELLPGAASSVDKIDAKIDALKGKMEFSRGEAQARLLEDGFRGTAAGIDAATGSTQDFINSLQELNDALAGRASLRDYEQAIDDFASRAQKRAQLLGEVAQAQKELAGATTPAERQAARRRIKDLQEQADAMKNTLDIGTQEGRDTQAALDAIATSALKVAQTLDPIKRAEFLAGARTEFIKAAREAGLTKDAAKALADEVLGLSQVKGTPKIVIDADGAWHVIDQTAARLERLTRKTYKINIQAQAGAIIPQVLDAQAHANGGTVLGQRSPYGDKALALLAPGEEVISNRFGQADRHRELLKAINANRYADGGTVMMSRPIASHGAWSPAPTGIDYDRLAEAVLSARPLYGDVTVQPHNYSEFQRQMEQDRRGAGIGGVPR